MTPAQRSEVSGIKGAEVSGIKVARAIQLAIVRCAIRLAKVRCAIRLAKAWLDDQISYRKLYEVGVPNWYPTSTVRRVVWNSLELLVGGAETYAMGRSKLYNLRIAIGIGVGLRTWGWMDNLSTHLNGSRAWTPVVSCKSVGPSSKT